MATGRVAAMASGEEPSVVSMKEHLRREQEEVRGSPVDVGVRGARDGCCCTRQGAA